MGWQIKQLSEGIMTNRHKQLFDWKELMDIFCIREGECEEKQRETLMKRINCLTDKYGREFVIRKVALRAEQ